MGGGETFYSSRIRSQSFRAPSPWNMLIITSFSFFPALDEMERLKRFGVGYIPSHTLKARGDSFQYFPSPSMVIFS